MASTKCAGAFAGGVQAGAGLGAGLGAGFGAGFGAGLPPPPPPPGSVLRGMLDSPYFSSKRFMPGLLVPSGADRSPSRFGRRKRSRTRDRRAKGRSLRSSCRTGRAAPD
ncbi:MAG: hypothetical protein E5X40_14330 [Mesorhizobium sp.]|nr:MAG: hypothetical protein EOQ62_29595 [Mesorhizobium sp.]RWJ33197.1 MAG: hypothetical protein EOR28_11470 [Mesorhizobium sp.]TIQ64431.1 MAG: hypothetical protein E5X41_17370 [Mesorhizobium sp.]TIQ71836.1 MAG: hypothetical protein E5X40_14330 [Mesorhizobium sp.]